MITYNSYHKLRELGRVASERVLQCEEDTETQCFLIMFTTVRFEQEQLKIMYMGF